MLAQETPSQDFWPYIWTGTGVLAIVIAGVVAYFVIRHGLTAAMRKNMLSDPVRRILLGVTRWAILVAVVLLGLQQAGVQVQGLWAAALGGVAMVAIGFVAVWSVLSNVLCSLMLTIFHPFRIGDEIEVIEATGGRGLRGKVVHFNVLFTSLEETTGDDAGRSVAHVPNNVFFQKTIRRISGDQTRPLGKELFGQGEHDREEPETEN